MVFQTNICKRIKRSRYRTLNSRLPPVSTSIVSWHKQPLKTNQLLATANTKMKSGIWTPEEDSNLKRAVESQMLLKHDVDIRNIRNGIVEIPQGFSWKSVGKRVGSRTGKQCRERWMNQLTPGIDKSRWSIDEENLLMHLSREFPRQWVRIAAMMPGRTQNQVKLKYRSLVKRTNSISNLQRKRSSSLDLENSINDHEMKRPKSFDMFSSSAVQEIEKSEPVSELQLPDLTHIELGLEQNEIDALLEDESRYFAEAFHGADWLDVTNDFSEPWLL